MYSCIYYVYFFNIFFKNVHKKLYFKHVHRTLSVISCLPRWYYLLSCSGFASCFFYLLFVFGPALFFFTYICSSVCACSPVL